MSAAKAGQAHSTDQGDLAPVGDALRSLPHPGITLEGLTVRWAGACWTVGRWVNAKSRPRWRDATWHGRLDAALTELLSRKIEGDVSEIRELAERIDRACDGIMRELYAVGAAIRANDQPHSSDEAVVLVDES